MAFEPKPGLVIRYDYLWRDEAASGRAEGAKDRPCAVIVVSVADTKGERDVVLCAITHSPPRSGEDAVAIPADVARRAGLDERPGWIKTAEVNVVRWGAASPFGVTPIAPGVWAYGFLPHAIGEQAFNQIRQRIGRKDLGSVTRRD